jgi:transcription elongation factor Elf1
VKNQPRKKPDEIKLPWGRNPLEGLLISFGTIRSYDSKHPEKTPKKKRKRYYSPQKDRPACPKCSAHRWVIVSDDERYRDPFLICNSCLETFRTDMTPLDFQYAWRDEIPMPQEIKFKYSPNVKHLDDQSEL